MPERRAQLRRDKLSTPPTEAERERKTFYASKRWRESRRYYLAKHPLCVHCQAVGRIELASHVHHVKERLDHPELTWEPSNFQALCPACHTRHHNERRDAHKAAPTMNGFFHRNILAVEFNGVMHDHHQAAAGKGKTSPDDPAVPGAIEFLRSAVEVFKVVIQSASFASTGREGVQAMAAARDWLIGQGIEPDWMTIDPDRRGRIFLSGSKVPCMVGLDDRAVTFDGTFPAPSSLISFKPWNATS